LIYLKPRTKRHPEYAFDQLEIIHVDRSEFDANENFVRGRGGRLWKFDKSRTSSGGPKFLIWIACISDSLDVFRSPSGRDE